MAMAELDIFRLAGSDGHRRGRRAMSMPTPRRLVLLIIIPRNSLISSPPKMGIPNKLRNHNHIHENIIPRHNNLPPGLTREYRTHEIRAIAQTPDDEEEDRQARCGLAFVVPDYLG